MLASGALGRAVHGQSGHRCAANRGKALDHPGMHVDMEVIVPWILSRVIEGHAGVGERIIVLYVPGFELVAECADTMPP